VGLRKRRIENLM